MLYHGGNALPHGYGEAGITIDTSSWTPEQLAAYTAAQQKGEIWQAGIMGGTTLLGGAITAFGAQALANAKSSQDIAMMRMQQAHERAMARMGIFPSTGAPPAGAGGTTTGGGGTSAGISGTTLLILGAVAVGAILLMQKKNED
jgi:hypothetical protein